MASIAHKLLLPILAIVLGHTVSGKEVEKRLVLNDPVATHIQLLESKIDLLNFTIAQLQAAYTRELADLHAALNAEKQERCRTGRVHFHHEECAQGNCNENIDIYFSPPFSKPPIVAVSLSAIDVEQSRNIRVRCDVSHVSTNFAILEVGTWADTIVHQSDVTWIACPQL